MNRLSNRDFLFQAFVGRWQEANLVEHEGKVLERLVDYDWKHLSEAIGLSSVYLLGLWDFRGPIVVNVEEGIDITRFDKRLPSVFAISNHSEIDPRIGSREDFVALVDTLHACDLSVFVDFVPNHTGTAHPWVTKHPDYYKKNENGLLTAFSGDVVELDYENPAVVDEMIGVLQTIVGFGVDGVRCDMAHLVPTHFWKQAISTIKQLSPDFTFIAEAYDTDLFQPVFQKELLSVGFDVIYDEGAYRNLKMMETGAPLSYLAAHLNYVRTQPDQFIHYVSNHDDPFPLNEEKLHAFLALFSTLPGMHLLFNGALWGRDRRIAHHYLDVLPNSCIQPSELPKVMADWFGWITRMNPFFGAYEVIGSHSIKVPYTTKTATGFCLFHFSAESMSLQDSLTHKELMLSPFSISIIEE
jgi:hypothetical protein